MKVAKHFDYGPLPTVISNAVPLKLKIRPMTDFIKLLKLDSIFQTTAARTESSYLGDSSDSRKCLLQLNGEENLHFKFLRRNPLTNKPLV